MGCGHRLNVVDIGFWSIVISIFSRHELILTLSRLRKCGALLYELFAFLLECVAIINIDTAPARFTANSACRSAGLAPCLPFPCASLNLLRKAPSPSMIDVQPPKICLKICSVCWDGEIFKHSAVKRYSCGKSELSPYTTSASSRICLHVESSPKVAVNSL